jgi:hypothetical protein
MGFSLILGSCLEVGVLDPSILKTERPLRQPRLITWLLPSTPYPQPRRLHPPARAGSFIDPFRTFDNVVDEAFPEVLENRAEKKRFGECRFFTILFPLGLLMGVTIEGISEK